MIRTWTYYTQLMDLKHKCMQLGFDHTCISQSLCKEWNAPHGMSNCHTNHCQTSHIIPSINISITCYQCYNMACGWLNRLRQVLYMFFVRVQGKQPTQSYLPQHITGQQLDVSLYFTHCTKHIRTCYFYMHFYPNINISGRHC